MLAETVRGCMHCMPYPLPNSDRDIFIPELIKYRSCSAHEQMVITQVINRDGNNPCSPKIYIYIYYEYYYYARDVKRISQISRELILSYTIKRRVYVFVRSLRRLYFSRIA